MSYINSISICAIFNPLNLYFYRAALTAGHCICGRDKTTGKGKKCLSQTQNQIQDGNEIKVFVYEKRQAINELLLGQIDRAYVKYDQDENDKAKVCLSHVVQCIQNPPTKTSWSDLGILIPKKNTIFVTPSLHTRIGPLCLPSKDAVVPAFTSDLDKITFAGQGYQYMA